MMRQTATPIGAARSRGHRFTPAAPPVQQPPARLGTPASGRRILAWFFTVAWGLSFVPEVVPHGPRVIVHKPTQSRAAAVRDGARSRSGAF